MIASVIYKKGFLISRQMADWLKIDKKGHRF